MPVVSIIIPSYNSALMINKCISSIQNQTYRDIEIIIIDDGSTDGSYSVLERLAQSDSRIKLFRQRNQGAGVARNTGVKHATGEYITFVDSDDYLEPQMLEIMLNQIQSSSIDMVICQVRNVSLDKSGEETFLGDFTFPVDKTIISGVEAILMQINFVVPILFNSMCFRLIKRDLFISNNILFPGNFRYAEDSTTSIKSFIHANKIALVNKSLYNYVHNEKSSTTTYSDKKAQDILLYVQETIEALDCNYPFISPNNFVLGMLFPIEKQLVYSENKNYSLRKNLSKQILDLRNKYKPSYFFPKGIPFLQKVKIASGYHGLTKRICQVLKYFRWIPFVRYML